MALSSVALAVLATAACTGGESPASLAELRQNGAFEFPQAQATVLCENPDLRFSVWNNQEYLFAQAVVWTDDDSSLGKTEDNREIGDWSQVMLDLDADGKPSAHVDRNYMLNPWPNFSGLGKKVTTPEVGQPAPEISAKEWINLKAPLTLASLHAKVVLLEFWATWCGPCVEGIPHLKELQRKYAGKNFQVLTLVEEGHQTMDKFLKRKAVEYPIGLESTSLEDYGVNGIPQAFLISTDGKILWHGHPAEHEMETAILSALKETK